MTWTPEAVETVRSMWMSGKSSTTISRATGLTRNTINGKLNRMGLLGITPLRHTRTRDYKPVPPRISTMIRDTCIEYGVPIDHVMGPSHDEVSVGVRHEIWRKLREEVTLSNGLPPSYPRIGGWFGRDHTTIRSGYFRAKERGKPMFDAVEIGGVRL